MVSRVYFNSLACVRVKEGESECFRIDSGVRQGCILSPWLFNVYMDAVVGFCKHLYGFPGLYLQRIISLSKVQ